jgi:hypothetical protein
MNIQTGDVYSGLDKEKLELLKSVYGDNIKEVPEKYADEVSAAVGDGEHGRVDMSVHTPLVGWANKQRIALKNKDRAARKKANRERAAKASRKQNRRK